MPDALAEQIEAYEELLSDIQKKHGAVWVLIAHRTLIKTFKEFADAAKYAIKHHGKEQVLIRHTDEQALMAPYVHIED